MALTDTEKAAKARNDALQGALTQIEREFGKGTIMRMGDEGAQVKVNAIPTGALSLDLALGIGGMPRGRIVEVFGPESSGKTTLVYHVLAEAQKLGGVCAFIDAEHAMDPLYAREIGARHRRAARLPARLRRAGAGGLRHARALGRRRRRRDRLGRRADAALRARGPDGRPDRRPAGADDEPGDAQARRQPQPHADAVPLHQPDPREGRRDVRLARDAARRSRAEVLRLPAPGHPPHRDAQGRHRGGRQPRARQGRQEQGRGAVPPGRVRHRVRQGHLDARAACSTSASSTTSSASRARSSPTTASGSARAATTPRGSSTSTRRSPRRSRPRSTPRSASARISWRRSSATRTSPSRRRSPARPIEAA